MEIYVFPQHPSTSLKNSRTPTIWWCSVWAIARSYVLSWRWPDEPKKNRKPEKKQVYNWRAQKGAQNENLRIDFFFQLSVVLINCAQDLYPLLGWERHRYHYDLWLCIYHISKICSNCTGDFLLPMTDPVTGKAIQREGAPWTEERERCSVLQPPRNVGVFLGRDFCCFPALKMPRKWGNKLPKNRSKM